MSSGHWTEVPCEVKTTFTASCQGVSHEAQYREESVMLISAESLSSNECSADNLLLKQLETEAFQYHFKLFPEM